MAHASSYDGKIRLFFSTTAAQPSKEGDVNVLAAVVQYDTGHERRLNYTAAHHPGMGYVCQPDQVLVWTGWPHQFRQVTSPAPK